MTRLPECVDLNTDLGADLSRYAPSIQNRRAHAGGRNSWLLGMLLAILSMANDTVAAFSCAVSALPAARPVAWYRAVQRKAGHRNDSRRRLFPIFMAPASWTRAAGAGARAAGPQFGVGEAGRVAGTPPDRRSRPVRRRAGSWGARGGAALCLGPGGGPAAGWVARSVGALGAGPGGSAVVGSRTAGLVGMGRTAASSAGAGGFRHPRWGFAASRRSAARAWFHRDAGAARLGESDGDRLAWRLDRVFSLSGVCEFLPHELPRLC